MICDNNSLADLDRLLGQVFAARVKDVGSPTEKRQLLKAEQKWVAGRNSCSESVNPSSIFRCVSDEYKSRIKQLGAIDQLIQLWRVACNTSQDWCIELADIHEAAKHWSALTEDLEKVCELRKGHYCFRRAKALLLQGKKAAAVQSAKSGCTPGTESFSNEACAFVEKIKGVKKQNRWLGLYREDSHHTLWIQEDGQGRLKISAEMDDVTSSCAWEKKGRIEKNQLLVDPDPNSPLCKPQVRREGNTITVTDVDNECQEAYCGVHSSFGGEFRLDPELTP